jgi:hypothetical protein
MTDCKALGMTVDKSGEVSQTTKHKILNDIDLLIIDEAYLICLDHLYRLYTYIKRNKNLKVLILGDPLQNEAICRLSFGEVMLKPYSEVIEEGITKISPYCVRLEINKRMYKDRQHLSRIKKDLFRKKSPLTTTQIVKYLVDEKIIGGKIHSEKDIRDLNIDKHLAYSNDYSIKLNRSINRFQYNQQNGYDICDGSYFVKRAFLHYPIGAIVNPILDGTTIVVGDKSLSYDDALKIWNKHGEKHTNPTIKQLLDFLCQERGVYILRKHHKHLVINSPIKLIRKPESKKDKYTFLNHLNKEIHVLQSFVDQSSIRYPYCRTGHSTQGSTIINRYMIHMYESEKLCSPNWFWTCLTRATSLQNVYIHILPQEITSDKTYRTIAEAKLSTYKQTDEAKGLTNETYDLDKMVELLKSHHYTRCAGVLNCPCDNMMTVEKESNESMSFDRIINSMGHRISNLRILCLHCNRTAKNNDDKI